MFCWKVTSSPSTGDPSAEVTLAVKLTVCRKTDGFGDALIVVTLAARTNWFSAREVLVLLLPSPLYVAVITFWPAGNFVEE